jgi:cysteine-rich repeat protein
MDPIDVLCNGKCGDGIKILSEGCDDGNLINSDGCNDSCEEEANYICVENDALKSICAFSQNILITLDRILKTKN